MEEIKNDILVGIRVNCSCYRGRIYIWGGPGSNDDGGLVIFESEIATDKKINSKCIEITANNNFIF